MEAKSDSIRMCDSVVIETSCPIRTDHQLCKVRDKRIRM